MIMAMVKADAYGHGLLPVSLTLAQAGADYLGVAMVEEGARLREAGVRLPILCVGASFKSSLEQGIKEDDMGPMHCDNARACYPEAKRMCETMLASYEAQYDIPYIGVRLCHTFGPGIVLDDGRAFSM